VNFLVKVSGVNTQKKKLLNNKHNQKRDVILIHEFVGFLLACLLFLLIFHLLNVNNIISFHGDCQVSIKSIKKIAFENNEESQPALNCLKTTTDESRLNALSLIELHDNEKTDNGDDDYDDDDDQL